MSQMEVLENTFRLNPVFKITPVAQLTEEQRRKFEHITRSSDIYGLLHASSDAKVTVKALNRPMVEFLEEFHEPKKLSDLPPHLTQGPESDIRNLIIRLVLDSVLEVRTGERFISGVDAVNELLPAAHGRVKQRDGAANFIQALSRDALELAFKIPFKHAVSLSNFLYGYNTLPLCRSQRDRFPDGQSVAHFLGIDTDSTWPGMERRIKPKPVERDETGEIKTYDRVWRFWYLRKPSEAKDKLNFKVYVSPVLDDLPAAFRIVRETAADSGAYSMKTARNVTELFRPDRLVIYFYELEKARNYALHLADRTKELGAQGVPFTYQVSPDNPGVSMGVDPPRKFGERNSWRGYVTQNLALAIQGALRTSARAPMEYVATQMHLLGIDTVEWRPSADDWTVDFHIEEPRS